MAISMLAGSTKNFDQYVRDNDGAVIDPDTLEDVQFHIYWQYNNELVASFSKSGTVGDQVTKDEDNKINFVLPAEATEGREGNLMIQITIIDNGGEVSKEATVLARVKKSY